MIETLNGIHETVNYKADTNIRLYDNNQCRRLPNPLALTYKLSCLQKTIIWLFAETMSLI